MFKPLIFFSFMLVTSSMAYATALSPSAAVEQFYAALKTQNCSLAVQLRAGYNQKRCEEVASPSIKSLEELANDQKNAVVAAQIKLLDEGQPQNFNGFIHLQKQADSWQLQEFVEASNTSAGDFIKRYMQPTPNQTTLSTVSTPDVVDLADAIPTLTRLRERFPDYIQDTIVLVDISAQRMGIFKENNKVAEFPISSATKGVGSQAGSDQTPLGAHIVSEKFGDNAIRGSIFNARRDTKTPATILTDPIDVSTDYVTTRILWLDGLEPKKNKGGDVDSKSRFIYIHGTPEEGLIGKPASHGCIRMKNDDVIKVYELLKPNTLVYIGE